MDTDASNSAGVSVVSKTPRDVSWRIFIRTSLICLFVIGISALGLGHWIRGHVKQALQEEITRNLTEKAQLVANRIRSDRSHSVDVIASQEGQAAGARVTVIDSNGQVVADSEVSPNSLPNEGRRPEFATALQGATGVEISTRNGARVLFVAVSVPGGAVRLACPLTEIDGVADGLNRRLAAGCLAAAIVGLLFSAGMSKTLPS